MASVLEQKTVINPMIASQIEATVQTMTAMLADEHLLGQIHTVAELSVAAYRQGNKMLFAGNGGSAADAQHIAGELVSRFYFDRPALAAIALTTDTSILTAIGNDYGYENLFSRQVEANAVEGDIFVGISTSGNSPNIIKALDVCRAKGVVTVGLTGETGGKMADLCDYCIKVPNKLTPRIQESHIMIGHIICSIIEEQIFGSSAEHGA